jgi:hypothetical protein
LKDAKFNAISPLADYKSDGHSQFDKPDGRGFRTEALPARRSPAFCKTRSHSSVPGGRSSGDTPVAAVGH